MDTSLITRRSQDEYWRPVDANISRARPQSGANTVRNGRQAAYFALWQQRQARGRVQSSRPLGTPRCFPAPHRPPSGLQPRPPAEVLAPHPPNAPASNQTSPPRTTTILVAQPPAGPPPRPDARNPILYRGRLPRRVLSSHFGGPPQSKDIVVDPDKRVNLVSPPDFSAQDIVVAPPVPWKRLRGIDASGMTQVKEEEGEEIEEKEDDDKSEEELAFSRWDNESDVDNSSITATPPPSPPPKFIPRPPAEPPDGIMNIRSILKRARMKEARLAPASSYLPSPMHGPVPQETELTEILTIRPKPMIPHTQRESSSSGRQLPIKQSDRGVRFDMANTEVFEIARRRPRRPTIFPDSFNLL